MNSTVMNDEERELTGRLSAALGEMLVEDEQVVTQPSVGT